MCDHFLLLCQGWNIHMFFNLVIYLVLFNLLLLLPSCWYHKYMYICIYVYIYIYIYTYIYIYIYIYITRFLFQKSEKISKSEKKNHRAPGTYMQTIIVRISASWNKNNMPTVSRYNIVYILRYTHPRYMKSLFTNIQKQQNMLQSSLLFKKNNFRG